MSITDLNKARLSMVRLSSSANVFHVLADIMKKDLWYVVVLHLGMTNLKLALLDDLNSHNNSFKSLSLYQV